MSPTALTLRCARRAAVVAVAALWSRDARAQITVSGSPAQMTISAAIAGSTPTAVSNNLTTYTVTKPASGHYEVTAQLSAAMPPFVTLEVALAANNGAATAGTVTLTTSPVVVVTGISRKETNQKITYTLSATLAAGVIPLQNRRVTLTVVQLP